MVIVDCYNQLAGKARHLPGNGYSSTTLLFKVVSKKWVSPWEPPHFLNLHLALIPFIYRD